MSTQDTTLPPQISVMQQALEWMEGAWHRIDLEWGPCGKSLDDACADGEEPEIANLRAAIAAQAQQMTPRCEGCGYLVTHREHLSCVRAMKQAQQAQQAQGVPSPDEIERLAHVCRQHDTDLMDEAAEMLRKLSRILHAAAPEAEPQQSTPCARCDTPGACREHEPGKFCQAKPQPSYRPDYPNSEKVLGAENEKARQDERLFGVGFTVNGWHVPAHLVSKWGKPQAPAPQAEPQPEREPLTDEQINAGHRELIELSDESERAAFRKGARWAEKMLAGIGAKGGDK